MQELFPDKEKVKSVNEENHVFWRNKLTIMMNWCNLCLKGDANAVKDDGGMMDRVEEGIGNEGEYQATLQEMTNLIQQPTLSPQVLSNLGSLKFKLSDHHSIIISRGKIFHARTKYAHSRIKFFRYTHFIIVKKTKFIFLSKND